MNNEARETLAGLSPDPRALLDSLRTQLDDSMLWEIAAADYDYGTTANAEALIEIRETGIVPARLEWNPKEVLELIRWSEPSNPAWKPGSTGTRGHVMRAFACAVLLRAGADAETSPYIGSECDTIAQLIDSCVELGGDLPNEALRLLVWRALAYTDGCELPFFATGVLLLAAAVKRGDEHVQLLTTLAAWAEEEARLEEESSGTMGDLEGHWLLGLTFHTIKANLWKELGWRLLLEPRTPHAPAVALALERTGRLLAYGTLADPPENGRSN